MKISEVIKALEICTEDGCLHGDTCGHWETDPHTNREYFNNDHVMECPFHDKRNCYKQLAKYSLLALKQLTKKEK